MKEIKEFEINMVVSNEDNKYNLDQINDMFIEWVESKGLIAGGGIKEFESSKEIMLRDIKAGEIFTIGETPSYPKLRTKDGYIDMRDKIVNNKNAISFPIRIMLKEEVAKQFNGTVKEVESWVLEVMKEFNTL